MKAEYERVNHTLEGIKAQTTREAGGIDAADPFACPDDRVPLVQGDDIYGSGEMVAPTDAGGIDADADQKVDSIPSPPPPQPAAAKFRRVQEGIDEKLRQSNEVFLDASGKLVKLDKNGLPYPVAADGVRRFGKDTVT